MDDALVAPGDITDAAQPARLVDAARDWWGRVDVVVGNAKDRSAGARPPHRGHVRAARDRRLPKSRVRPCAACPERSRR